MVDDAHAQSVAVEHCPWCSAEIAAGLATCPACHATLLGDNDASLPGVTSLDPEAIARASRPSTPQRRSRLLSWISGDFDDTVEVAAPPGSLSPPPPEVRREMLRLELQAEYASLAAESEAMAAEARAEGRVERPVAVAPTEAPEAPTGSEPVEASAAGPEADATDAPDTSDADGASSD